MINTCLVFPLKLCVNCCRASFKAHTVRGNRCFEPFPGKNPGKNLYGVYSPVMRALLCFLFCIFRRVCACVRERAHILFKVFFMFS